MVNASHAGLEEAYESTAPLIISLEERAIQIRSPMYYTASRPIDGFDFVARQDAEAHGRLLKSPNLSPIHSSEKGFVLHVGCSA